MNQPLAALASPFPSHTQAHSWHTQSELVTFWAHRQHRRLPCYLDLLISTEPTSLTFNDRIHEDLDQVGRLLSCSWHLPVCPSLLGLAAWQSGSRCRVCSYSPSGYRWRS